MPLSDEEFRLRLREVVTRSGLSLRRLSLAMGRDVGYLAALLDPARPSRARPTPADLLAASDATGIGFSTLLELLWDIPATRLADEVPELGLLDPAGGGGRGLGESDRQSLRDFAGFLAARRRRGARSDPTPPPGGERTRG